MSSRDSIGKAFLSYVLIGTHLCWILLGAVPFGTARAQTAPTRDGVVEAARAAYEDAEFEQAIALLEPTLQGNQIAGAEKISALEILARCYFKKGEIERSMATWKLLRQADPAWRPGPNVPADEAAVFQQVLAEPGEKSAGPERHGWATWKWIAAVGGGGLLVAGAVVALLGGGGAEPKSDELGNPPPPPGSLAN